jgi:hypothetical protein
MRNVLRATYYRFVALLGHHGCGLMSPIYVPPEQFDFLTRFEGADPENPGGLVRAEFFVVRGLKISNLTITEGQLLGVPPTGLDAIRQKLIPTRG